MADKKISQLTPATTPLAGTEELPIVQGGSTVKVSVNNLTAGRNVDAVSIANGLGAVGTPSYTFTGDTNTGMWSPAADTLAFSEGGVEVMRITSAGNVGIGTTSPGYKLDAVGTTAVGGGSVADGLVVRGRASDSYGLIQFANSTGTVARAFFGSPTSGSLAFFDASFSERMRITSAGNVGIGTSSPSALLDVNADTVRVRTAKTPASATATGNAGDICWDSNYVYVCVATDTWKRSALSTW